MKKKIYLFLILGIIITLLFITYINKYIPLYMISSKTNVINIWGWKLVSYSKYKCLRSYYLIKTRKDNVTNFAFDYYVQDRKCDGKKGLGDYDLIKVFTTNDSIFNVALTIQGDTLYINKRPKRERFFSIKNVDFIKGKYYYYYKLEKRKLDSCQLRYFEKHKDSLIKVGANNIPEFNNNCKISGQGF